MKVATDLDGTISADPAFYRAELAGLMQKGHEVHVVTGNAHGEQALRDLGFMKGRDYTTCSVVPLKHIASAKVAFMKSIGATHLIDNRKKNIRKAVKAGFTAHHHLPPNQKG